MYCGDIVVSTNKTGFLPRLIRWVTNSKFNHCFIMLPELLNQPLCIEALVQGVTISNFNSEYATDPSESYEIYSVNVSRDIKQAAMVSIMSDLHIEYGFLQYPWFVYRSICKLFKLNIEKQNNWNTSGIICSQLCIAYLKALGLENVLADYGTGAIDPQDLQNILVSHPALFTKIVEKV